MLIIMFIRIVQLFFNICFNISVEVISLSWGLNSCTLCWNDLKRSLHLRFPFVTGVMTVCSHELRTSGSVILRLAFTCRTEPINLPLFLLSVLNFFRL
jgi:hypothetical protein